jgi:hypothetical protein
MKSLRTKKCLRTRFLNFAIITFLVIAVCVPFSHAQTSFGTITGSITDPTGALVPNATVTITNLGTNGVRTLTTDDSGSYNVPSLSPGQYVVKATAQGFSTQQGTPIVLAADQTARLDFKLALGGTNELVTVDTTSSALQTDSPTVGATIDAKKVVDLPLNGRNFVQLTQLIPGVNPGTVSSIAARRGRGSIGQSDANGGLTATQINGQRDTQNRYFIEGSESMDYDANTYSFSPSVDAISQFKVDTSSSTAEYGAALGGFINVILKSGTNAYHGTLWEFNRNNYFTRTRDFISTTNPNPTAQRLNRNQFGGNIGGPVRIPWLYNGKDRTFFFVNEEEGRNLSASAPSFLQVPTITQQAGNLTGVTGRVLVAGTSTTTTDSIIDPTTGLPFPNKQIPVGRISPSALKLLSYTPPNGVFASNTNYRTIAARALATQRDIITRLDHQLFKNDQINGHYIYDNTFNAGAPLFGHDEDNNRAISHNLAVSEVHTFNSRFVNTAIYGYHRFTELETFGTTDDKTYDIANAIGIPFASTDPHFYGPPIVSISGPDGVFSLFQLRRTIGPRNRSNSAHTIDERLSAQLNKHFVTFGTQFTFRNDTFDQIRDPRGNFNFNGQWTGSALADFLLGYMNTSSINPTHTYTNIRDLLQGYFIQDSWRASQKLTLTLGVRWDHMPPWVQNNDQYAAIATLPNGTPGTLLTPATSKYGRGLIPPHYYDFAPRLGFAYQPWGDKTVIRGGFGLYFTSDIANQPFTWAEGAQAQAGAALTYTNQARLGVASNPQASFTNPFPGVSLGGAPTYPFANAVDPELQDARTAQFNITAEQQLPFKLVTTLAYVGARTRHNYSYYSDVNIPFPVDPTTPGLASLALRRPNQVFRSGGNARSIVGDFSNSSASYDSLQAKIERRVGNGLTILGAYTWSHAISGPSDIGGYVGGGTFGPNGLNIYNPKADRSSSIYDLRQRFVGTVLWDVPFFHGTTGFKKLLLDGIQVSTIYVAQTGPGGVVSNNLDRTGTGLASRADLVSGQDPNSPAGGRTNLRYFNTAAFTTAALGTFGNEPRTSAITLPGISNDDTSFMKGFKFGESRNFQIRADIFNLFLHYNPNPNAVGVALNNTNTFGKLGGGTSDQVSRIIQLSGKLYF